MGTRQRRGLLGGLALLSGAALMLEVSLARVHAAVLGPEIGYPLWAIALLSLGLGVVATAVLPSLGRSEGLLGRLGHIAAAVSATSIASVIYLVYLSGTKPGGRFYLALEGPTDLRGTLVWASLLILGSLPFALTGLATGGALRGARGDAPGFCLAHLLGAAAGSVAAIAAVRVGGPRAILIAAVVAALAALVFALGGAPAGLFEPGSLEERRPVRAGLAVTLLLGSAVLVAGDLGAPWLKASVDGDGVPDKPERLRWTELGLITVERASAGVTWIREDALRTSRMVEAKTQPPPLPEDIAYAIHRDAGPVLVIDAGGGRDVRMALKAGQRPIEAAVLEPAVNGWVMRSEFAKFNGGLYDRDEVRARVDDGRGPLGLDEGAYRHVVVAARAEGPAWALDRPTVPGLATTAGRLHTREAVAEHLDRLLPRGTLVVVGAAGRFDRLLAVALAALRSRGVERPRDHLYGCEDEGGTALLLKRTPLDASEITALRKSCASHKFTEAFAPDQPNNELRASLADATDLSKARGAEGEDLSPPTDDRPFRAADVAGAGHPARYSALLAALGLVVALVAPLIARPAVPADRDERALRARAVLFLGWLGVAAGAAELGLCRAAVSALGHPRYSLAIVVPALLLGLGLGAVASSRVEASRLAPRAAVGCAVAAVLCAGLAIALWLGLRLPGGLGFLPRLAGVLALIAVTGAAVGLGAPLGLRLLDASAPERTPWGWGAHLVGRVVGATGAVLAASQIGFALSLLGGAILLLGAAALFPRAARPLLAGDAATEAAP